MFGWKSGLGDNEYRQIICWEGTELGVDDETSFISFVKDELALQHDVRVIGNVKTLPGRNGPGGRIDLFFIIHNDDVIRAATRRLKFGMRWMNDCIAENKNMSKCVHFRPSHHQSVPKLFRDSEPGKATSN
jgi:hypothetical protein